MKYKSTISGIIVLILLNIICGCCRVSDDTAIKLNRISKSIESASYIIGFTMKVAPNASVTYSVEPGSNILLDASYQYSVDGNWYKYIFYYDTVGQFKEFHSDSKGRIFGLMSRLPMLKHFSYYRQPFIVILGPNKSTPFFLPE